MKFGTRFLLVALLLVAEAGHAGSTNLMAKLAAVPPYPSAVAAATAGGIPLTGFDSPTNGTMMVPGDAVTGLVTLRETGRRPTQWLICFEATTNLPPTPGKTTDKPRHPMVLNTSTGHRYEFARSPASIKVRILGPFKEPNSGWWGTPTVEDHSTRVSVDEDFLSLGLDVGAAAIRRWGEAARAQGATNFAEAFEVRPKPFDSARTNRDAILAARWGVTAEEERAVAAWDPALDAYFGTVGMTPNLRDILWKVLSLPSIWSFVKNRGVQADFELKSDQVDRLALTSWGLPGEAPVYSLPSLLTINKHPSLAVTMLVTAPRPPLLVCGGVVGFLAENPMDEENYLTLRIIGAHCHPATAKAGLEAKGR